MRFVRVKVVYPYISTDTVIAWKKSRFISLDRSDFRTINSKALPKHMLTSVSVDELLLPMYVNWSTIGT